MSYQLIDFCLFPYYVQCDAIRWEQFKIDTAELMILIMKTLSRPYSCLAKVICCLEFRTCCS